MTLPCGAEPPAELLPCEVALPRGHLRKVSVWPTASLASHALHFKLKLLSTVPRGTFGQNIPGVQGHGTGLVELAALVVYVRLNVFCIMEV